MGTARLQNSTSIIGGAELPPQEDEAVWTYIRMYQRALRMSHQTCACFHSQVCATSPSAVLLLRGIMRPSRRLAISALSIRATLATDCCRELSQAIGQAVVNFPGSSQYDATEASYWSLQESDLKPACIVRPTSAQGVSRAIKVIKSTPDCKFAIKGQGHSPAAGFANVDGGVTLDMTSLASIETSSDHSVAKVGAGASWLDVYRHLDPLGVEVAGGRNGNVGVGGLLLEAASRTSPRASAGHAITW
ncbi:hypothetical protein ACCO45_001244 [Purpureocillium lilacinum]|uniref:Uncharacterized protein n=1 Tax=Purpureocillium lilacinum TaxID=33203 RepID=A0ACC4E6G6_PURLI